MYLLIYTQRYVMTSHTTIDDFTSTTNKQPKVYKQPNRHKPYGTRKTTYTQLVYIFASLLWVSLIYLLDLYPPNWVGWLIILLPLLIFAIGFYHADTITIEVEDDMFKVNHLALGLIIVLALFTWLSKDYSGDRRKFVLLVVIAMIFSLIAVIDVWVRKKWFSLIKHIKSALQTLSIVILIYALYLYFWYKKGECFPE